ncbi:MAG TPA: hypothetical protein G4O04_05390 [Anaerolineae bacterium]|nr:hypothetical protein [Anaerolineae bacterium]HID85554.1 hypothetical protein [Anaerolineales bacterium]HIQ08260.1 hypothetical protein [Anaerolineaceae bacterium]
MPIYPLPSVHGYDVTDFRAVNPDYGTLEDLQRLVQATHERGMRVILDFVPSHFSREHLFFRDAYGNPASPYSDWFVWTNDARTTYATFGGSPAMPRFNHYNLAVVDYLVQSALFWLNLDGDITNGVDGFRVDNVTFSPPAFLQALYAAVKQANPQEQRRLHPLPRRHADPHLPSPGSSGSPRRHNPRIPPSADTSRLTTYKSHPFPLPNTTLLSSRNSVHQPA